MRRLLNALAASRKDLLNFVLFIGIVWMGFSVAFHIGFGQRSVEFVSVGSSCMALLRLALGSFDLNSLLIINSPLALGFTVLFFFTVCLVLLGVVFAIVTTKKGPNRGPASRSAPSSHLAPCSLLFSPAL